MRDSHKFDHNLLRDIHLLVKEQPANAAEVKLQVTVRYTGDLEKLEECGLHVFGKVEGMAIGEIAAGDLDKLEQLENVISVSTEGGPSGCT